MSRDTSAPPEFSIVVPCFNEVGAIRSTIAALQAIADRFVAELIVVDDGSTDGTREMIEQILDDATSSRLLVVRHRRNRGYGAAVKSGVRRATSELIVIVDADGTYPVDRIPDLVAMAAGADMVVGARTGAEVVQPAFRRLAKWLLRAHCSWLVGERIPDMNSGLRVFRRPVFDAFFKILPDGFSLTTTLTVAMMRSRYHVVFEPVNYAPRVGRSKIRPVADTLGFLQLILRTGMYFAPLRVVMPLVVVLSLGFLASLWYDVMILSNLTDKTVLLLLFAMNTALFGMLADMIDKRS